MDKEQIRNAKRIICSLCDSDMCEWCRVEQIVQRAENDEQCVRSSTNGDYSPSNPWDAPGMSIKDFI
jgi:hypothetical protein